MLAFFNWEITSDLFFGTVSSVFSPNMFKKQDGMLAFFVVLCLRFSCPKLQKTKRNARLFRPNKIMFDLFCVLCRRFSFRICLKNMTKCSPFLPKKCQFLGQKLTHFHTFWGPGVPPEAIFQKGVQTTSQNLRILVFSASLLEVIFVFFAT